jgi:malate synthase
VRTNVSVGVQYLASWLAGTGAAAINNLMEDAATAEISRAQVWQWVRHGVTTKEGQALTRDLVKRYQAEELRKIGEQLGLETYNKYPFDQAAHLFERVALSDDFPEFLTLPAYELID